MSHSKLTLRQINRVALVPAGANRDDETGEGAHIVLAKMEGDRMPPRQRLAAAPQVADSVSRVTGAEVRSTEDVTDRRSYRVSFAKAQAILGFRPTVTLEQGMDAMEGRARYDLDQTADALSGRFGMTTWAQGTIARLRAASFTI